MSNEVKGFQPVHHSCKNAVDHVIFGLAYSESPSLKEDFRQALSVLGTVFVKLPVGAMRLYFVVERRLKRGTIGLWL